MTEITNDDTWHIINSFVRDQGIIEYIKNSYNDFILKYIPDTVNNSNELIFKTFNDNDVELEIYIKLLNPILSFPIHNEHDGKITFNITPNECRLRKLSYMGNINTDVVIKIYNLSNNKKLLYEHTENILLCEMPIMVQSKFCTIKTEYDKLYNFECVKDYGGYFIVNGSEKIVIGQERMTNNEFYIFSNKTDALKAEIKSSDFENKLLTSFYLYYAYPNRKNNKVIRAEIQFIKKEIPLTILFKALGITDIDDIINMVCRNNEDLYNLFVYTIEDDNTNINTQDDALEYIGLRTTNNTTKDKTKNIQNAILILSKMFLPHTGSDFNVKAYYVSEMCFQLLKTSLGLRDFDDRDHYGNKRVDLVGELLHLIFSRGFDKIYKDLQNNISRMAKKKLNNIENLNFSLVGLLNSKIITKELTYALSTGNWGNTKTGASKTGVSQVASRLNILNLYSQLRRLTTPSGKNSTTSKPRQLHNTQWGLVCLTGDTQILIENYKYKCIKDLKDGDVVVSVNPTNLYCEYTKINNWFMTFPEKLYQLKFCKFPFTTAYLNKKYISYDESDSIIIKCTPDHKFLINTAGHPNKWIDASQLKLNDIVYCLKPKYNSGNLKNDIGISCYALVDVIKIKSEPVYDFTTCNNNHSFIANNIVTHNCSNETPEGQSAGFQKNTSFLSHVTLSYTTDSVLNVTVNLNLLPVNINNLLDNNTCIYLNGQPLGFTNNLNDIFNTLKSYKLRNIIPHDCSVYYDTIQNVIKIWTDSGRCSRPLFLVNNSNIIMPKTFINKLKNNESKWKDLFYNGYVEYVDAKESENILVANYVNELNTHNYTHCEINPATILGVIASVIPFPDRQPAPRTTYETGMAKQSIGANSMAYRYRMDTNSHVLWYPQKSLVPTKQYNLLKLDDLPSETNCIVAICSYYGWDQEDGIIINQGAIDKGLFKSFYFKTYTDSENKNSNNTLEEYFQKSSDTKSNKLPDDGIVNPGTKIKDGDRIIDKVINTLDKNKNSSIDIHKVESAVVDKVLLTNSDKGQKLCKVQLRITKTPEIGDKFASKYAQKGTCCMILPQEDMPFTHEGITPDIIINPLCIPSRGTIGHLIESLFGKYSCLSGEILDSTAFNCQNDPKVIGDILQSKYNYSYTGKERLINGINGQMMLVDTYIGVNHYHKLKHLVSEKYQSRARGPVTLLTRQPINLRWVKTYVKSITLVVCHTATSSNCGNILIVFYSERVF